MSAVAESVIFDKELGITHRDFVRILSRVVGEQNYRRDGRRIVVEDSDRRLEITLSEEKERRIALVVLPVTRVRFAFTGYDDPEQAMLHLDRHFQRGGG